MSDLDDDALIREFFAICKRTVPPRNVQDHMSEEERLECWRGIWSEMAKTGFAVTTTKDGGLSYQDTKKADQLYLALEKRGLVGLASDDEDEGS